MQQKRSPKPKSVKLKLPKVMPAEQKSCECVTCQGACLRKPGWFLPGEAEKAAEFLKMHIKEFFEKYLAIDWWNGAEYGKETFILAPALMSAEAGEMYPAFPVGRCIFFVNSKCAIHPAKPFECQMYWHGEEGAKERHRQVAEAWEKHQNAVEQIYGRKPVAPELTMHEMLGFMTGMFG